MTEVKTLSKKTLILVALIALFVGAALAAIIQDYLFPGIMTVTGTAFEFYVDNVLYENGTTIDWGSSERGESWYIDTILNNTGSTTFTAFWIVTNLPYNCTMTCDWNGTTLAPTEQKVGTIALTVGPETPIGTHLFQHWLHIEV